MVFSADLNRRDFMFLHNVVLNFGVLLAAIIVTDSKNTHFENYSENFLLFAQ